MLAPPGAPDVEFQFLIGTIKTKIWDYRKNRGLEFQFLIGTIKTGMGKEPLPVKGVVSIPYRYDKNTMRK